MFAKAKLLGWIRVIVRKTFQMSKDIRHIETFFIEIKLAQAKPYF